MDCEDGSGELKSNKGGGHRWQAVLDRTASAFTVLACMVVIAIAIDNRVGHHSARSQVPSEPAPPSEPQSIETAAVLGDDNAKVVLIQYTDFECPYCRRFAQETLPVLRRDYVLTGRLLLASRNYPLPIHRRASTAALAAECARRQGKFWQMHDGLFAATEQLDATAVHDIAAGMAINLTALSACMSEGGDARRVIEGDVVHAHTLSIAVTPTFLVGIRQADRRIRVVQVLTGARPLADFRTAIGRALRNVE